MKSKAADVTFKSNEVILNQALQNCKDWLKVMTGVNVSAEAMKVVAEKALQSRSHSKAFVDIIGMTSKESDLFTAVKTLMDTVSAYSKLAKSSSIAQQVLEYVFTNVETYGGMEKLNQHLEGLVAGKDRLMLEFGVGLPGTVEKTVELTVMKKDKMSPYSVKRAELLTGVIDLMKEYVEDAGRKYKEAVEAILNLNRFVTLVNEYAGLKKPEDRDRVEQQLMQNPLWENFKDLVSFPEPGSSYDYSLDIKDPSVKAGVLIRAAKVVKAIFEDASMMLVEVSNILDTLIMGLDEVVEVMSVPEEEYLGIADQGSGNFDYGMALAAMRRKALDMSSNVSTEEILKARQILEQAGIPEEIVFMLEIPEEAQEELKIAAMKTLIAEYIPMFEKAGNPDDIKASLLKDVQSVLKAEAFNKLKVLSAKQIYSEIVLTDRFISANLGTPIKRVASIKPLSVVAVDGGDNSGFDVGDGDDVDLVKNPYKRDYMMLSRLKQDCDYYLGNGGRQTKHLWAKNEADHIAEMKKIYNKFPADMKPEWLSMEDINQYAKKMGVQASKKTTAGGGAGIGFKVKDLESLYFDLRGDVLVPQGDFSKCIDLLEVDGYEEGLHVLDDDASVYFEVTSIDVSEIPANDLAILKKDPVDASGIALDATYSTLRGMIWRGYTRGKPESAVITVEDFVNFYTNSGFEFEGKLTMAIKFTEEGVNWYYDEFLPHDDSEPEVGADSSDYDVTASKRKVTAGEDADFWTFVDVAKEHINALRDLFETMPDKGLTEADSQKVLLMNALGKLEQGVSGLESFDLNPSKDPIMLSGRHASKSLEQVEKDASKLREDLDKAKAELKKDGSESNKAKVADLEERLKRAADIVRNMKADKVGASKKVSASDSSIGEAVLKFASFSKEGDRYNTSWGTKTVVGLGASVSRLVEENEDDAVLGKAFVDFAGLKPLKDGRYDTSWGTKTLSGLGASLKRIVEESAVKASKEVKSSKYSADVEDLFIKRLKEEYPEIYKEASETIRVDRSMDNIHFGEEAPTDITIAAHLLSLYDIDSLDNYLPEDMIASVKSLIEEILPKSVQAMDTATERPLSQLGLEKFQKGENWGLRDIESKEVWFEPTYTWIDDVYNGTTGMVKTKDSNGDSLAVEILDDSGDDE